MLFCDNNLCLSRYQTEAKMRIYVYHCNTGKTPNMTKKLTILIMVLLTYSGIQAQTKSLLYEISGNGLTAPSYIYGTMHVSDRIAFHLTDSFFIALKSADVIALESNPETWIENDFGNPDKSSRNAYEYDAYDYGYGYNQSDFYTTSTKIEFPDANTYAGMFADYSWLINGYLYRYDAQRTDYEEETYLDLFIFQCGKKLSKDIAALEGEQEVLKLLQKAYEPSKDEDEEKKYIEKKRMQEAFKEDGISINEQIDQAYRDGDLDRLDSLERITSPSSQFHKYFIEERNVNMVNRLDSILRSGKIVFTGIGAAHLPGQRGALTLLREMGYTVKPVKGKISNKSAKEKNKIDAIHFSHTPKLQTASDSSFTVSTPGKLYSLSWNTINQYYLYPDMSNSAYYSVMRITHKGDVKQQSQQEILEEIDKLLFENVPGDITNKTPISLPNGYIGYDITSKTKRGNYMRFKLYVTPLETIVFKASGIGDFVIKSKEMQTFFSSINFKKTEAGAWSTYQPKWGLFSVNAPAMRLSTETSENSSILNEQSIVELQARDNNGFYYLTGYYLNEANNFEEDSFELVQLTDMFTEQFKKSNYTKVDDNFGNQNNYPAYSRTSKSNENYVHTKVIINGPYYFLLAAFTQEANAPDKFLNSFQMNNFVYQQPFEYYVDTALDFTVQTIIPKVDTLLTIDEISYGNYYRYDYGDEEDEEDISYLSQDKGMLFSSEVTPENIAVMSHKYNKFYAQDDSKLFWESFDSVYTNYGNFHLSRRKFVERDSIQELSFYITDTNSTRAVYRKFILKDDVLFSLVTTIDTLKGPSKFVSTFYDTFAPGDSISGRSIFTSTTNLFFEQLNSEDSVLRKQALNSLVTVDLKNKDAVAMMQFIQSPRFKTLDADDRATFIYQLGELKHPDIVPFLKSIYLAAGDTSMFQLAALRALSSQQSDTALAAFMELLYIETPLAKEGVTLDYLFYHFADTIELSTKLFPALLDFISFPEYKTGIYNLLSTISANDKIKVKPHTALKKQILTEATAEYKRNMVTVEEDDYAFSYRDYQNKYYFPSLGSMVGGRTYFYYGSYTGPDEMENYSSYGYDYAYNYEDYDVSDYLDYNNLYGEVDSLNKFPWAHNLQDYYSILLTTFYDDPGVKKYFDKILQSKDEELIYTTALTLQTTNKPVPDSVWMNLQKSREWRYIIMKKLTEFKKTELIDSSYTNPLSITEACLYQYEFTDEEDSIQFVERREVDGVLGKGYIYFYKSKLDDDRTWHLDCIGLQPLTEGEYTLEPEFIYFGKVILDEEQMQEQITEIIDTYHLIGRTRVSTTLSDDLYGYDYDYDY